MDAPVDWSAWHEPYQDPGSPLARRLAIVQGHIRSCLEAASGRDLRVLSVCAGDGRDLLGVLDGRPDAGRVRAVLVELDPRLVARIRVRLDLGGSAARVEVRRADAGSSDAYGGAVPADLVLLCGVLGNVDDADVRRTIAAAPQLCAAGGVVIWTRSRRPPDLTPAIRRWFAAAGFSELAFDAPEDTLVGVGVHRFDGAPATLRPGRRLFSFVR
jgi:hypothetical protein